MRNVEIIIRAKVYIDLITSVFLVLTIYSCSSVKTQRDIFFRYMWDGVEIFDEYFWNIYLEFFFLFLLNGR